MMKTNIHVGRLLTVEKLAIFISVFLITQNMYCQVNSTIHGFVLDNSKINDSILLHTGNISRNFYEISTIESFVSDNKFKIEAIFNYPHMYYLSFFSENTKIPFRKEIFFIDDSTKILNLTTNIEDIAKNNSTSFEYYKDFVPFMIKTTQKTYLKFRHTEPNQFDTRLEEYILENESSYVALWILAERICNQGFKKIYLKILNDFSIQIKESILWNKILKELNVIQIRLGDNFPKVTLKNVRLEYSEIKISKNKYVLVDFWFSRCKPCLEQFPVLKEMYEKNSDSLEIVSISTDKTENINLWQKMVGDKALPWQNFIDENGVFSSSQKINSFPTNYLLDKNGIVIRKNIDLTELKYLMTRN